MEQNSGIHKGSFSDSRWTASDDERNNYPYAQEGPLAQGKVMDLNVWPENDAMSLSRQIFGEKSSDPSEPILRRDASLDDEDMGKSKRESHSLSIVNPLDVPATTPDAGNGPSPTRKTLKSERCADGQDDEV
ncbi:CRF domain-containing protein [Trichonephila inaurata madagascariensis]|uniref:CRF domain-containing protein n=1 Tax=Trichonephila inaurata madagascariensis TaxID=2747483 RepID=A0A8X7CIT5_9ARAC|nr:CRF domain-containing protein [Trichonephila inaurata madagascariensis]